MKRFSGQRLSEDSLLAQCHQFLWNSYPELRFCCWHVANERKISPREGAILRKPKELCRVYQTCYKLSRKNLLFWNENRKRGFIEKPKNTTSTNEKTRFEIVIIRDFEVFRDFYWKIFSLSKIMINFAL